jgi:hypothetical protein
VLAREELEGALLRLEASLYQAAVRLLAGLRLLAAYNLATLVLHQILARQTTLGVVGRAVEDLGLGADRHHMAATDHTRLVRIRSSVVHTSVVSSVVHF